MRSYWVKMPRWLKYLFHKTLVWRIDKAQENTVYLTFDDGPHPMATVFVLEQLALYNAKATFFCVGNNVQKFPDVYNRIIAEGHTTGNHTFNHLNGWKTDTQTYISNIEQACGYIHNKILRPPYGRIKKEQVKMLVKNNPAWKIYMWDVLSADFDKSISLQQCADNVLDNISPGSIVVFHDSEKAWERMSYALPSVLAYCAQNKINLAALPAGNQTPNTHCDKL